MSAGAYQVGTVARLARAARASARVLGAADTATKNKALERVADALHAARARILAENRRDVAAGKDKGLSAALIDRLALDEDRIAGMAEGLRQVAARVHCTGALQCAHR